MSSIGIVMPVFNGAKYLRETLTSILNSESSPSQLILIDDGSTDESAQIAREVLGVASFDWKVVSQANSGEAKAVNTGVAICTCDYLMIINADDPIEPKLLGATKQALDSNPDIVVAYPDWNVIDDCGALIRTVITREFSRELLYGSFVCIPGPGAMIRRTAIVGELRDHRLSHVADYGTWLSLALQGDFIRVPVPLANWRQHSQGQTHQGKGPLLAGQYVQLMTDFFNSQAEVSEISEFRHQGIASAHYQAAIQGLFASGVRSKWHLMKAFALMSKSRSKITQWPFSPVLIVAVIITPLSRWGLNTYYALRKSLG